MDIITLALAKKYANKKISELADIGISYKIVETLPTVGEEGILYLVKNLMDPSENNLYNEYMYIGNTWEYVGKTGVDLNNINEMIKDYTDKEGFLGIGAFKFEEPSEMFSPYNYWILSGEYGDFLPVIENKEPLEIIWDGVSYIMQPDSNVMNWGNLNDYPCYLSLSSERIYTNDSSKYHKVIVKDIRGNVLLGKQLSSNYIDLSNINQGSLPVIAATDEANPVNLSDYAENGTAYIVKGHFFTPNTRNSMLGEWADWFLLINADAPNGDVYQTLRPFSAVFLNGDYVLNSKIAFKLASEDEWKTTDIFTGEYDDPTALGGFSPAGAYMMYNDIIGQMNTYVINPSDEAYTTFFTEGEEEFNFINEEIGNDFAVQLAEVLQTIYDKYTSNEYGILLYLDNQPVWFKATDLWDEPESLTLANTYIYNGENGPLIKEVGLFITLVWEDGYITQIGVGTGHNYINVSSQQYVDDSISEVLSPIELQLSQLTSPAENAELNEELSELTEVEE